MQQIQGYLSVTMTILAISLVYFYFGGRVYVRLSLIRPQGVHSAEHNPKG